MNADDQDSVLFMDVASHLGFLGYSVEPPSENDHWYLANHPIKYSFWFRRQEALLRMLCRVSLGPAKPGVRALLLRAINAINEDTDVAGFSIAECRDGDWDLCIVGNLPLRYEQQEFGSLFLLWQEECHRLDSIWRAYEQPENERDCVDGLQ